MPATRQSPLETYDTATSEREPAWAGQLAEYVASEFRARSSWWTRANVMVMSDEADPQHGGRGGAVGSYYPTRPSAYSVGSAIPTGYMLRDDTTVSPTIPADVVVTTGTLVPHTLVVKMTVSRENVDQVRSIGNASGADLVVPAPTNRIDPWVSRTLATGALKAVETYLVQGGTDSYPVGLLHETGTGSQTASGDGVYELSKAIAALRSKFRDPNLVLVSPEGERYLRAMHDSSGRPIFPVNEPLAIGEIPIVTTSGLPTTQPQKFIVLDSGLWNVLIRKNPNGKAFQVDRSYHASFASDQYVYRLTFRFDAGLTPVSGPDSTTVISITTN